MKSRFFIFVGLLAVIGAGGFLMWQARSGSNDTAGGGLVVYCAAGIKGPVEKLAAAFEKETGVPINLNFGGTATLLSQLRVAQRGDLLIAADDASLDDAREFKLIREVVPLAKQHPALVVQKGNAKGIRSLDDLLRDGVSFALTNPEAAAAGRVCRELLGEKWDELAAKAAVMKPTVTEIATDVMLGAVDAALVWDSTAALFDDKLEVVMLPGLSEHEEPVGAAVLTASKRPTSALMFARFLASPERGADAFAEAGFIPSRGDAWQQRPELVLFSGGVNRPAIEQLVQDFANREGVVVTTVFNGCGILCASMKTMGGSSNPKFPDVYYACDVCFVPPVAEHFPEAVMLTETEILIAVPKGNPKGIKTLADLARPGLKIGICNAEQSTLGFMTASMLKAMNLWEGVSGNASSQVPTGDLLVAQLQVGALDAAVVYEVNVQHQADHFDLVRLPQDKARAIQPFAVRKDSKHREMCFRLLAHLRENKDQFEQVGFIWRGDEEPVKSAEIELPEWLKQPGQG